MPFQYQPLATRMRPRNLKEFVGQSHLLDNDKPLRLAIEKGQLHSMILWGPPGTGKTTLAQIMADNAKAPFERLSAISANVKEIRQLVMKAEELNQSIVLFIDEVHRFNKAQQDIFLPYIENGTFVFIGATTENPSFEINNALLSRLRVYRFKSLSEAELLEVLESSLFDKARGLGTLNLNFPLELRKILVQFADGDTRQLLNIVEIIGNCAKDKEAFELTETLLMEILQTSLRRFDKGGDLFYDQISALHKAVRGSSPDAALYWLCRLLDGGCDPLYIGRRLLRMASEDIGLADPRAVDICIAACQIYERLGSPEGELGLAEAVLYLSCASKSNAAYLGFKKARMAARKYGTLAVPAHLCNAPTQLMKNIGHGKAYRYAHDEPNAYAAGENYFPEGLQDKRYYFPVKRGLEEKIAARLDWFAELDKRAKKPK